MSADYRNISLLSLGAFALVVMGAGCMPSQPAADTNMPENNNAMMEDDASGDTMLRGEEMNDDPNMVGGDAMINAEGEVILGDDDAMMEKDDAIMMEQSSAGSFEAYSEDKLSSAEDGTVVLAFLADWCPSCRNLKQDIESQRDEIPADLTILQVNYDEATELKQKYQVRTQHTMVEVDAKGNMIQSWSGGNRLGDLVARVQ